MRPRRRTATIDPTPTLAVISTYTATIKGGSTGVKDIAGNALAGRLRLVVHDRRWRRLSLQHLTSSTTPGPVVNDPAGVELGLKFKSDIDGLISGVRFYKYAQNTGAHVGTLWTAGGTNLAASCLRTRPRRAGSRRCSRRRSASPPIRPM